MPFSVRWGKTYEPFFDNLRVFFVSCLLSRVVPRSRLVSPPRADLLTKGFFRNNDVEPFNPRETVQKTYSLRGRNRLLERTDVQRTLLFSRLLTLSADTKYGDAD